MDSTTDDFSAREAFVNACLIEAQNARELAESFGFRDEEIQVASDGTVTATVSHFMRVAKFESTPDGKARVSISTTMPAVTGYRDVSADAVTLELLSADAIKRLGSPVPKDGVYAVIRMDKEDKDIFIPEYDLANAAVVDIFFKVQDLRQQREAAFKNMPKANAPKSSRP